MAAPPSLERAACRLRAVLSQATADGFARLSDPGLHERLRVHVEALARRLPDGDREPWRDLYRGLAEFSELGRNERAAWVARALRLCMTLSLDARPSSRRERDDELLTLPGVGPKTAAALRAAGICGIEDLACQVPRGYEDHRRIVGPAEFADGAQVGIEGSVVRFFQRRVRGGRFMAFCEVDVDGIRVFLRWFHPVGGLATRCVEGRPLRAFGRLGRFRGRWTIVHPTLRSPGEGGGLVPRYREIPGVGPVRFGGLCRAAAAELARRGSPAIPETVARAGDLLPRHEALAFLHAPPPDLPEAEVEALLRGRSRAHRSLLFEELFYVQLALAIRRDRYRTMGAAVVACAGGEVDLVRLQDAVGFAPTGAQVRVLREIAADLGSGRPMMRLLQGDVGSGKTFVAFGAAVFVADAGAQTAFMAPTDLLARQHAATLRPWCERAGLRLATLTGKMGRAERETALARIAAGRVDVVVGTHALLAERVAFRELGLAVVDEQHRFGVEQRARLREKGGAAHLLVMTATPIPRTVALAAYGELDLSVIDELPPGRGPTKTEVFLGKKGLALARARLAAAVRKGAKAFAVCPLVEASEAVNATNVQEAGAVYEDLVGAGKVAVVHGRMDPRERHRCMDAFRRGDISVLVATTVVEVGVDVPDAEVILVEHAERFGLAQLHQLRGRVGRGCRSGTCLLHAGAARNSDAGRRLEVLARSHDGFAVAEADLAMRGPGEVFGRRQSGAGTALAGIGGALSVDLVERARRAARELLAADPGLDNHPAIAAELERRRLFDRARGADAG